MTDNLVTLVGSMVRDPTLTVAGKSSMCRFTIGVEYKYRDPTDKTKKTRSAYYEVRSFGELAINLVDSCRRGDSVIVVGKLTSRAFTQDAAVEHAVEILAQHVGLDFLVQSTPFDESIDEQGNSAITHP